MLAATHLLHAALLRKPGRAAQLPSCGSRWGADCLGSEPVIMLSSWGHPGMVCSQLYMWPA